MATLHRFPDTFAVGLLQAGVPIERFGVAGSQQHQGYREALLALGASAAGAAIIEVDVRRTWERSALEMKRPREEDQERGPGRPAWF
jgi:hypothetical protein